MNKNKRIITILSIFTIIFTLVGGTFAYWTWTSNVNTGVAFTIEKEFSCSADGGQNINSTNIELQPTSDCTNSNYALQREIKVTPTINRDNLTINLDMWLTVNNLSTNLSNSENLMYAITTNSSSCTSGVVSKGNFRGLTTGGKVNLLSGKEYTGRNLPNDTYYLYIWLDAAETNNNTQNQSFNFSLDGKCTDDLRTTLSETVMALAGNGEVGGITKYQPTGIALTQDEYLNMKEDDKYGYVEEFGDAFVFENGAWKGQTGGCYTRVLTFEVPETTEYQVCLIGDYTSTYIYINFSANGKKLASYAYNWEKEVGINIEDNCKPLGTLEANTEITISNEDCSSVTFQLQKGINGTVNYDYGYRYQGENPDNYVKFNDDELWRIVSVEEGSAIGLESGKYYTKIIRNDYIYEANAYEYDAGGWGYTKVDDMPSGLLSEYYNNTTSTHTNFGLTQGARNMIVSANWYAGEIVDENNASDCGTGCRNILDWYFAERKTSNNGYVGLLNASDVGLSILKDVANDGTFKLNEPNVTWLTMYDKSQYLLNPVYIYTELTLEESKYRINPSGKIENQMTEYVVRPVVYLDSTVKITNDGDGSEGNPFELGL